jgi:DNA repair protein RecO (recombination protein O)
MRVLQEPGFVLHTRPYRETSLLLEVLSREHGRVGLVARGAKSARSRWKNRLQPVRPLLLAWNQRGELGTLTGAEEVATIPPLRGQALMCGLYANELLIRFLHRSDPHPEVFQHYRELISTLASEVPAQALLRVFERDLLRAVGLGLQLELEHGSRRPVDTDAWYEYIPESGPVRRDRNAFPDLHLVSGAALIALRTGQIAEEQLRELKLLMRGLIRYHLGDKPLASHELFRQVSK